MLPTGIAMEVSPPEAEIKHHASHGGDRVSHRGHRASHRGHRASHRGGLVGRPTAAASPTYRALLIGLRAIGRGLFGFSTEVLGLEHIPRAPDGRPVGGWIAAGLPHRTWVDPFVVADNLPTAPRLVFFGDGRAIFRSRWRRWLVRRVGGVIPIWPGGGRDAVEAHLTAASAALEAGAVLCLFPETGPATPPGTARPFGSGFAYFAIRTGAPIVPVILGGTHELFRGRRFRLELLPAVSWQDLVDAPAGTAPPEPWSSAERRIAHRVTHGLHQRTAAPVAAAHHATQPKPGASKRWRWLTTAWH
jgi:1-acyl-sn-glycerol-3-phosphate acyltransferase